LIRDAAYGGLLKRTHAELHERFAPWLEVRLASRIGEFRELIGFHLEQAHRYLLELGPADEHASALGRRAAEHLGWSGTRALARGDVGAATNLLRRAVGLLPKGDPVRRSGLGRLCLPAMGCFTPRGDCRGSGAPSRTASPGLGDFAGTFACQPSRDTSSVSSVEAIIVGLAVVAAVASWSSARSAAKALKADTLAHHAESIDAAYRDLLDVELASPGPASRDLERAQRALAFHLALVPIDSEDLQACWAVAHHGLDPGAHPEDEELMGEEADFGEWIDRARRELYRAAMWHMANLQETRRSKVSWRIGRTVTARRMRIQARWWNLRRRLGRKESGAVERAWDP